MSDANITDITVIGGGPTGLYAAFYAGLRAISCRIVDALPQLGGQLMALYPEKYIFDVGGLPKILAKDLANNMIEQGTQFGPEVVLGAEVQQMVREDGHFRLVTPRGDFLTRTVCVTAGKGALNPRVLECPGWDDHYGVEGGGAHTHVRQIEDFRDRRVLIVGGGDSAVDWVLGLRGVARSVTLIHRRPEFRAHKSSVLEMQALAEKGEVQILTPYEVRHMEGVNGCV
ncbi:MAG TPA: NAD(P)/FAD-dependent oxidoreductase, partial [Longimicrobium sp.]|uniref:NAD(P)/FAD-dependent oxidoreductase n=1 Tax=Longimicrobium sp. TaxID=2029185 RepID=UPI002EDAE4F4